MARMAAARGGGSSPGRPEKPTDHGRAESLNERFGIKSLNAHWFLRLENAKGTIEA